jgi:Concanavalin A-like lectin/glucanases superfamily/Chitobiase/beta-hexosaminidase C-terminal domain/CotH kinase protein/Lamin Tail Domain
MLSCHFMKRQLLVLVWGCLSLASVSLSSAQLANPVIISEFMAKNSTVLTDEDNDHSDWIELHNLSSGSVNLDGWFLTDTTNNLCRWRIPATNLVARGYFVIFASGKNRSVPGLPLHTSFQLGAQGEYLALVMPDGVTIATEFAPAYPDQFDDTSYGMGMDVAATQLVAPGAPARFLIPLDGSVETNWMERAFNDTAWSSGKTGLGFDSSASASASGLYAYWPVQEGSGNVASNLVAGGADGILQGAAWVTNDPDRGTVLSFNGQDSYVSAGAIPRMGQATTNFTWSFWYRQNSVPNVNAVILGNRSGGAPGGVQFIKFTPSNFEYYHDGDIGFIPHTITTGGWHHLAVVKQGPSLSYYDNGALVGTSTAAGDIEANPFYWGGDPGATGECADGLIDDVSLWTTALTADQIKLLYQGVSPFALNGLGGFVTTDIGQQMFGVNASAYIRIPFTAPLGATFSTLTLRIQYDDGFIAYLNGVEVARRNAPTAVRWNSTATAEHPVAAASVFEEIDISAGLDALVTGGNVLAIQTLNLSAGDPDFLILPELKATTETAVGWRYFDHPTPGGANDSGFLGFVADVKFDHDRGFYDAPFSVAITCATPEATIRYTTNGTEPSLDNGATYEAPLPINGTTVLRAGAFKPGYHTKRTEAQSYLFLDQVLVQNGAGLPTDWGNDWQMDPRVVTNSAYAGRIRNDMKSLPIVSIALDPMDFWGPAGVYTQTGGRGADYERACSAELFFPDGSRQGFQINCGIQIVGSASRFMSPKHGVGLTFKSRYGSAKLKYRFFEDSEVDQFDFIAFRPNFNMSWVRTDNSGPLNNSNADGAERLHAIYVRDQFAKESQLVMGQVSAHERFVHLYINGLYWGLYNPSERNDSSFAASYYGGTKADYDAIFSDPSTIARAHNGDKNAWNDMMNIARQGLAGADAYARIQQYLDGTNLADYMMLNFYCATVDWPWQNWNAARKRQVGAQFQFYVWDAEYTLETPPWVPDDRTGVGSGPDEADSPARLYYELRKNAEWRLLFADRAHKHFFNNGALTTNQTIPRFLRLCDAIDRAIVGESARWGDVVRTSRPYTRDVEWLAEKSRLLTQFFPQRTDRVIQQFIKAGLYPNLPAPEFSQPGGTFTVPLQLTMNAPAGIIYFTTNGLDPRLPGGAIAPEARLYLEPIVISSSQQILARAWQTNAWSALNVESFTVANPAPALVVRLSGSAATISWPAQVKDFILEVADTLASPQWTAVGGVVENQVTVNVSERSRFYRLRKPL